MPIGTPPLLRRMVAAGWLGQKSERGFYAYDNGTIVA
jgi:3-hydroxyacyl-CoA dehydrogenase